MTALPATFQQANEAAALAFARCAVARMCEPDGAFHPQGEALWGRQLMKQWAIFSALGADDIVYFAENGSKEADAALRDIIADRIDRGEPLGAVLGAYNIRLLNPTRAHAGRPAGKANNFVRDVAITAIMSEIINQFGLRPTRNTISARRPSASTVVADALSAAGVGAFGHKGVERVWQRYCVALQPAFKWNPTLKLNGIFC